MAANGGRVDAVYGVPAVALDKYSEEEDTSSTDDDYEAQIRVQNERLSRRRERGTLQDLSNMDEDYDDDDDDDSDWEDRADEMVCKKWFCINCTMANFGDMGYCDICGEHRDYNVLTPDCSASDSVEDPNPFKLDLKGISQGVNPECTAIGFDERMLLHFEVEMKSHPHPERPDRLRAIVASLSAAGLFPGKCSTFPAREITAEELQRVHSVDHVQSVESTKHFLLSYFTPDTYANRHSACAARLAAGLCSDLASTIMSGRARNGFALVRPPGHHAGVKEAMGFCLHNNAAVASVSALAAGAKKVLIIDWDVHHGNGTQEIFEANKSVLYVSLHRHENGRFYPGTGAAIDVGSMEAKGYCVNIPWKNAGIGDNDYIFAFQHAVLPIASEFAPDLTIISAGFDAARGDPLGGCDVTPEGYAQMTHMLNRISQGRLLVILEGGYNLRSISSSATAVVKVLLGEVPSDVMDNLPPSRTGLETVLEVLAAQLEFWPMLKPIFAKLKLQFNSLPPINIGERKKKNKKRRIIGPIWWKWGSKRLAYKQLFRGNR